MVMVGRPSLYDPAYCDDVLRMGGEGYSVVEMAAEIGVHRNTLETLWPEAHPDFMEALGQARQKSQAWWERQGRVNLATQGFQSSLYSRSMAARFPADWREVKGTELTGKDGGPVQTAAKLDVSGLSEQALREIAALRAD
jgi:hypothetical protein